VLRHYRSDDLVEFLWPDGQELVTVRSSMRTIRTSPQEARELFDELIAGGAY
jgi:hypothetical protein